MKVGVEAGVLADGAVDVLDPAAAAADRVMVIVIDPGLVPGDGSGRLDPAQETGLRECAERVVDRLVRHGRQLAARGRDDRLGVGVGEGMHGSEHGDPRPGHAKAGFAEEFREPVGSMDRRHVSIVQRNPETVKIIRVSLPAASPTDAGESGVAP